EIRSEATSASLPSGRVNRSRTLPERRYDSASTGDLGLSRLRRRRRLVPAREAGDDRRHVAQEAAIVEAGVELGQRQAAGDDRLERKEIPQRAPFVGGLEGDSLDEGV